MLGHAEEVVQVVEPEGVEVDAVLLVQPDTRIAEVEGEPVGFASATLKHQEASDTVREDRALHVHELAVAPQARRAGAGRALMQAVEDCARSLQLTSVSLNTWLFNTEARGFYERLGYQRLNMQMRRRL